MRELIITELPQYKSSRPWRPRRYLLPPFNHASFGWVVNPSDLHDNNRDEGLIQSRWKKCMYYTYNPRVLFLLGFLGKRRRVPADRNNRGDLLAREQARCCSLGIYSDEKLLIVNGEYSARREAVINLAISCCSWIVSPRVMCVPCMRIEYCSFANWILFGRWRMSDKPLLLCGREYPIFGSSYWTSKVTLGCT